MPAPADLKPPSPPQRATVLRSLDRALRSRTWAMSAWSAALPAGARVRPGRPSAAAEQADAEPAARCRAAAGRLDGHLLDYPRRLSAHRSPRPTLVLARGPSQTQRAAPPAPSGWFQ